MKKIFILLYLLSCFNIHPAENSNNLDKNTSNKILTNKDINNLKALKYSRNIGIAFIFSGLSLTMLSIPGYSYSYYSYRMYNEYLLHKEDNQDIPDLYFPSMNIIDGTQYMTNLIFGITTGVTSLGMLLNIGSIILFIISASIENKYKDYSDIPSNLKLLNLNNKLFISGLVTLIPGSISLTAGISGFIYSYYLNNSDSRIDSGVPEYTLGSTLLISIGAALDITGIILLIMSKVYKQKNINNQKLTLLSPVCDMKNNNVDLGLVVRF